MIKEYQNKAVKSAKTKKVEVKFKDDTLLYGVLYKKDTSYEIDEEYLSKIKDFIY